VCKTTGTQCVSALSLWRAFFSYSMTWDVLCCSLTPVTSWLWEWESWSKEKPTFSKISGNTSFVPNLKFFSS
jgi:hypothetical protein